MNKPYQPFKDAINVFKNGNGLINDYKARYGQSYRKTILHALGRCHDMATPCKMRLVIIESPYAGEIKKNVAYANAAIRDCIKRGETPYASHIMLTGALRDSNAQERKTGIEAGYEWARVADAVVVYKDLGVSDGMREAIAHHRDNGRVI